ncbi:hypothetical protein BJX65DRAFT_314266 [Aspergillus insuetus]
MARAILLLQLRPAPGSCPANLFNKILQAKIPYEQRFHSEIGNSCISVEQIDGSTMVLLTKGFSEALNPDSDPPLKYYTHEDHMCNGDSWTEEHRAWKTTHVYEIIGNHSRLVRFLGRDHWTALPILEKPFATLAGFLEEHYSVMYAPRGGSLSRHESMGQFCLTAHYRPLIFQWALQLLSGLSFIHP